MATVDKNFRVKNGLVVEGSTATVGGNDVLTKKQADQDYIVNLIGGTATSANTANSVVKRDSNGDFSAGTITADLVGNVTGQVSDISNHTTSDLTEGSNKYFTNQRALDATSSAYDAAGSASTAQTNAENYADGLISTEVTNRNNAISTAITNLDLANTYDALGAASTAETNAKSYTDQEISGLVNSAPALLDTLGELATALQNNPDVIQNIQDVAAGKQDTLTAGEGIYIDGDNVITGRQQSGGGLKFVFNEAAIDRSTVDNWYDASGAAATAESNANSYTDNAISSGLNGYVTETGNQTLTNKELVDPFIQGQIKLEDSTNTYAAYITLQSDELVLDTDARNIVLYPEAGGNVYIDNSGSDNNIVATQGYVSTQIGNISTAVDQINGASISPNNVTINSVANQYATSTTGINVADGASSVFGISATSYRTLKALVKAKNGNHTQVSEILVTLDTSNNVAITEYAMVGTNGSLGDVSAIYHVSGNIFVTFTPAYDNTDVMVYATALV